MSDLYLSLASAICIGLSIGLFTLLLWSLKQMDISARSRQITGLALGSWLLFTAAMAISGQLQDFSSLPPRIFIVVMPALLTCLLLTFHPGLQDLWRRFPSTWLIGFQTFRVGVEIFLWLLFLKQVLPIQMTFEGRNWDILTGLTAPVMVWIWFKKPAWRRASSLLWNLAGLALLINIVGISVLSMPTAFQVFKQVPANTFIASFPFVWLPSFLVPMALLGHCLALRQRFLKRTEVE